MSEDSITAAFHRFDADGNGKISRSELATVLKEIGPDTWDDKRIDELFSNFDTSETHGIQYEDFVKWVCNIGKTTSESTFAKWSSATVDELVAAWGSFDVVRVSNDAQYCCLYSDDVDTHAIKLKADGGYEEYHDRQKELSGYTHIETGMYQIMRCIHDSGVHLVLAKPKRTKGEAWSSGGGDEWDDDIENPQDKVYFLDRDLKTIRTEKDATFEKHVYQCKDDVAFA